MSSQKHILDELRSLGSSLPDNNNQPYSVPEGYFDGLAASILAKLKVEEGSVQSELEELSPLLAGIPKRTPFSVPSSYFEENIAGIGGLNHELESPVLAAIGKTMPYGIPQGYFETLPGEIAKRVKPSAKVVPLLACTWMRVASAAAVAGALFFGGYQVLSANGEESGTLASQTGIDTFQQQMASNMPPIRKEMKQVSTKELEAFIETVRPNTAKVPVEKSANKNSDKLDVEELLKDVSTSEMESFLSAIPTVDDDLMIID